MNYKIIQHEEELLKFIDWLPNNNNQQKYYISLMARKKYNPTIPSDKQCLKRVVSNKRDILSKLDQMETKLGTYRINNIEVPNNALVVYISINPRDIKKAAFNTAISLMRKIEQGFNPNPKSVALDEIQKATSNKFITFDIDSKENFKNNKYNLVNILGYVDYNYIETNGGYHLIVNHSRIIDQKTWYHNLLLNFKIDQKGDLLSPIPGCIQGNFIPRFT